MNDMVICLRGKKSFLIMLLCGEMKTRLEWNLMKLPNKDMKRGDMLRELFTYFFSVLYRVIVQLN